MGFQDMPPPGGFASIPVERTMPKPIIRQGIWAAILVALSYNGIVYLRGYRKARHVRKVEQTEHYIASHPFILAEQERNFLRFLKVLREDERELMKDHPGWKLGTLYGEPVFKTIPKGQLPPVNQIDFNTHRNNEEWYAHVVTPNRHT